MSSLLALASAGSRNSGPAAKRQKTEGSTPPQDIGSPYFSTLFTILSQMREEALKRSCAGQAADGLEIEIRLGMIVQNERRLRPQITTAQEPKVLVYEGGPNMRFVAGVDEHFLEDLKRALVEKNFKAYPQPPQRLVCGAAGNRVEVEISSSSGGAMRTKGDDMAERKDRIYRRDLALLSHGYDIRMDAAHEVPLAAGAASSSPAGREVSLDGKPWTSVRLKKRTTYRAAASSSGVGNSWKVDVTEVEVTTISTGAATAGQQQQQQQHFSRELEVEIELEGPASKEWLTKSGGDVQMATNRLLNELMSILTICVPCDTMAFASAADAADAGTLGEACGPAYESAALPLTQLIKASLNASHTITSFVGTMPVSMSRRSLLAVQRNPYYIAEKTDGVRYLLYVIKKPDSAFGAGAAGAPLAVLMDRKGAIFNIKGGLSIGAALGVHTVLDGELVYNRSMKTMVFLLFDVLAVDGQSRAMLPFGQRYQLLESEVVSRYKRYMDDATQSEAGEDKARSTQLVRKIFYKKEQLPALVGKLRTEDGERVFFDSPRRHWKSDGIVFQPDSAYVVSADQDLLKWKWPELRSVDLQARVSTVDGGGSGKGGGGMKYKVSLFALGPDGVYIDCTSNGTSLAQFDQYRLLADISAIAVDQSTNSKPPVVEVVYDTTYGVWRYKLIRSDKKEPNAIATTMGVLMELAESIPIEELEYCFGTNEVLTDFSRQLNKMKRQLLDWQKKAQTQKK